MVISMIKLWTVFSKMGIIFSRFKKKSSVEQLENVEEEIKELQACSADTEMRHRKITRQLMIYSSGLCVIFATFLYFYIPTKLQTKIILGTLLLLSPIIYYAISTIISWYYRRKIRSSHSRLKDLQKEKKRLIDEIMDKETYKVAKDILEKYAPETLPQKNLPRFSTGAPPGNTVGSMLRTNSHLMPPSNKMQQIAISNLRNTNTQRISSQPHLALVAPGPVRRVPPLPRDKSYLERFFEYLIGDGPNTRYALICNKCATHNGMALMEEFEYTAFKCYACQSYNPARKQRPVAPKLESDKSDQDNQQSDGESNSPAASEDGALNIEEIEDEGNMEEDPNSSVTVGELNESSEMKESLEMNIEYENSSVLLKKDLEESGMEWNIPLPMEPSGTSVEELKTEAADLQNQLKGAESLSNVVLNSNDLDGNKTDSVVNGSSDFQNT